MKKKILLSLAALFGVVALAFAAWAVETNLSFGCPSCGNIIVVNIRSNADQGRQLIILRKLKVRTLGTRCSLPAIK